MNQFERWVMMALLVGCGTSTNPDTGDTADTGSDTAGDTAADTGTDTGVDTDSGSDSGETGDTDTADTADTADTGDTAEAIAPLVLRVTNGLEEPIDFVDALDSQASAYHLLIDDTSPLAIGETREFEVGEGRWSLYAETPTMQCGSVENVVLSASTAGYHWDITSLIYCGE